MPGTKETHPRALGPPVLRSAQPSAFQGCRAHLHTVGSWARPSGAARLLPGCKPPRQKDTTPPGPQGTCHGNKQATAIHLIRNRMATYLEGD